MFFSGVVGDTLGGMVSDKLFEKTHNSRLARCNLEAVMMFLCAVAMVPLLYTRNLNVVALALTAGFFFAEMTIGPMWAIPMDIAPKFAGTASGLMNTAVATSITGKRYSAPKKKCTLASRTCIARDIT